MGRELWSVLNVARDDHDDIAPLHYSPHFRISATWSNSMSFQDIETGLAHPPHAPTSSLPQSREESAFLSLQSSLSLQVFKINANVQGILKLVDQMGTARDTGPVRSAL